MKPVSRSVSDAGPPPSHPDVRRSKPDVRDPLAVDDRIARLQMLVALALGVLLVFGSLYLWRRPAPSADAGKDELAQRSAAQQAAVAAPLAKEPIVLVGEPRVVGCQNPGPGKTELAACGNGAPLAAALKQAITDNEACLPPSEGAGTIEFLADFQFERKRLTLSAPQSARSVKSSRAAVACATAVKRSLLAAGALNLPHDHARMKLTAQASYAARTP